MPTQNVRRLASLLLQKCRLEIEKLMEKVGISGQFLSNYGFFKHIGNISNTSEPHKVLLYKIGYICHKEF